MHSICFLLATIPALQLTATHPSNPFPIQLLPINATLTAWPDLPYSIDIGDTELLITQYGRWAPSDLELEIPLDFDSLRRQILASISVFTGAPIELHGFVVQIYISFIEAGKISRKDIANVISTLKVEMTRHGALEVNSAVIAKKILGKYVDVAQVKVGFTILDALQ